MFEIAPKQTEIKATWDEAKLYCMFLDIDGKKGWRLPTKEELNEIYESDNDFQKSYYWSSTERNGNDAWNQNVYNGGQKFNGKNYNGCYVRAVRSLS